MDKEDIQKALDDLGLDAGDVLKLLRMLYTNCEIHKFIEELVNRTDTPWDNWAMKLFDKILGYKPC